jgi:hypothetical protein
MLLIGRSVLVQRLQRCILWDVLDCAFCILDYFLSFFFHIMVLHMNCCGYFPVPFLLYSSGIAKMKNCRSVNKCFCWSNLEISTVRPVMNHVSYSRGSYFCTGFLGFDSHSSIQDVFVSRVTFLLLYLCLVEFFGGREVLSCLFVYSWRQHFYTGLWFCSFQMSIETIHDTSCDCITYWWNLLYVCTVFYCGIKYLEVLKLTWYWKINIEGLSMLACMDSLDLKIFKMLSLSYVVWWIGFIRFQK